METELEKQQKAKATEEKRRWDEVTETIEKNKQLESEMLKEFEHIRNQKIDLRLQALKANEINSLKNEFGDEMNRKPAFSKRFKEKKFDHPLIQQQWKSYLAKKLLSESENDFERFKKSRVQ